MAWGARSRRTDQRRVAFTFHVGFPGAMAVFTEPLRFGPAMDGTEHRLVNIVVAHPAGFRSDPAGVRIGGLDGRSDRNDQQQGWDGDRNPG
jgi:hypothetical protein